MERIIIDENQRGILFKNGRYVKVLSPGKYFSFGGRRIVISDLEDHIDTDGFTIRTLLSDPAAAKLIEVMEVGDGELGIHFRDGRFAGIYRPGSYAFWNIGAEHSFRVVDATTPDVPSDLPESMFQSILPGFFTRLEVPQHKVGLLFFDQKYNRTLEPGVYYFWKNGVRVECVNVDTRLTRMEVAAQEMLTLDKVSVRVNFVFNYKITDCVKIITEIDDYGRQLYVAAQLAIREFVSGYRLDELLDSKEKMAESVLESLKASADKLYVEISDAGVKDIILPGEIREIMNTVLVAEKRAQASVIARREEVASTRSLLNTAKLMEENATLYKLKELEYIERICENVGSINVGGGDILAQLTAILAGKKE